MTLETLVAEREIHRQLVAFARAMDKRDWDALSAIVTDDIRADFGAGEVSGRAEVIAYIRSFLDNCGTTQHLLGNVVIDVSGDTATSEAYVADLHLHRDPGRDLSFRTLGNYRDSWVKSGGTWLMSDRRKDNRATVGSMDVFKP